MIQFEIHSPLFTVTEAAKYLRISRSQMYRELGKGNIDYVSIASRKRMIEKSALDQFIATRRTK